MRRASIAIALCLTLAACSSAADDEGTGGAGASGGISGTSGGSWASTSPGPSKQQEHVLAEVTERPPRYVADPLDRFVPMWRRLDREDPSYSLDTRNPNGELSPMLIVDATFDEHDELWLEVLIPIRPNGASAWVRSEDVEVDRRRDRIEVDLSKRLLWHYRDGELVDRFKVGVGQPRFPTGTGTFYVWVTVSYDNPNQPYGIFALGLSGFSPAFNEWPGGGRMAIHGTPYASNRGQAVSYGCVRVYNDDMESLVDIPLGTPVLISK